MEGEIRKIENNLCRCCHAEGEFHNFTEIKNECEEDDFPRMLLECLSVSIAQVPGDVAQKLYSICGECVMKLKDAISFKKQILICEIKLMHMIKNNLIVTVKKEEDGDEKPGKIVKTEPMDSDDMDDFYYPASDSDGDDGFFNVKSEVNSPSATSTNSKLRNQPKRQATKRAVTVKKADPKKKAPVKAEPKKKAPEKDEPNEKAPEKVTSGSKEGKDGESKTKSTEKFIISKTDYKVDGTEYICCHCNRHYKRMDSLKFHLKNHYNIPNYKCPKCPELFRTVVPFVQHKLQEHGIDDRLPCNACDKVCNTKVQLKKHKNIFHMLGQMLKCSSCSFETLSHLGLYRHRFKHKKTKDYHCQFCKKSFLRHATLKLHEKIHTGDKRKVCPVCSQAFVQKASLNYHMTKYHPNVNF